MSCSDLKKRGGIVYDASAAHRFAQVAVIDESGEARVPLARVESWAVKAELALDVGDVFFRNLQQLHSCRAGLASAFGSWSRGRVEGLASVAGCVEGLQCGLDGGPIETLDALEAVAVDARDVFEDALRRAVAVAGLGPKDAEVLVPGLKARCRCAAKARSDYDSCVGRLLDVVRGSIVCGTEDDVVAVYGALRADARATVARAKNRFDVPAFTGYRDVLASVRVTFEAADGAVVSHTCEVQIHARPVYEAAAALEAHKVYEFFRGYLGGLAPAEERRRLSFLLFLPDGARSVADVVADLAAARKTADLADLEVLLVAVGEDAHARSVASTLKYLEEDPALSDARGADARARGDLASAAAHYRASLRVAEERFGPGHEDVAACLNSLGEVLQDAGDYAAAEPAFRRALAVKEAALGPSHLDVAACLNNLAMLLRDRGELTEALELSKRELALVRKKLGDAHPDVALSLNNLACLLRDAGDTTEAERLLKTSLQIYEDTGDPDHPDAAATLRNLAGLLSQAGQHAKAEALLRRALGVLERLGLGPDLATTRSQLARALHGQGKPNYERAHRLYVKALDDQIRFHGADSLPVATVLNGLAAVERDLGNFAGPNYYASADAHFRKALHIRETTLEPTHPDVAESLANYAGLLWHLGNRDAAEPLQARATKIKQDRRDHDADTFARALAAIRRGDAAPSTFFYE